MMERISAFALALVAGSAFAGPVGNVVGGATGLLGGAGARATTSLPTLPALPLSGPMRATGPTRPLLSASSSALPGLGGADAAPGPLGVTVLQEGADGSGYDYVLNSDQLQPLADALSPLTNEVVSSTVLNQVSTTLLGEELVTDGTLFDTDHFIDDGLDNNLVSPLLGADGDGGYIDAAVFDGNGSANAGDTGLGAALGSGSDTGNGGGAGIGIANDDNTGNGGFLGIAALSGTGSGNSSDGLGVGVLNQNDTLHVCAGGTCGSLNDVVGAAGSEPLIDASGIVVGGGSNAQTSDASNPLLNIGVLTGDNVGNGGEIGVGALAGSNSANGKTLGVCLLCGDNVANSGSLGVAVLSGNNSGIGNYETGLVPVGVGAAVLSGNNSGNGGDGTNPGDIGIGALNGGNSGNGESVGVGAVNGGNGAGSGPGSGGGGIIGVGVIGDGGNGGGITPPGGGGGIITPPGGNNGNSPEAADDGMCALEVRDGKGRLVQALKRPCKQLAKGKTRTKA